MIWSGTAAKAAASSSMILRLIHENYKVNAYFLSCSVPEQHLHTCAWHIRPLPTPTFHRTLLSLLLCWSWHQFTGISMIRDRMTYISSFYYHATRMVSLVSVTFICFPVFPPRRHWLKGWRSNDFSDNPPISCWRRRASLTVLVSVTQVHYHSSTLWLKNNRWTDNWFDRAVSISVAC